MGTKVTPYNDKSISKKEQVATMFDKIAGSYDFLNHLLSLGIDILWRKKAVNILRPLKPKSILDVATGTGDFAIESLSLNPERVIGIDISKEMINVGISKIEKKGYQDRIFLEQGDGENIAYDNDSFDAITIGFGVRNFEDVPKGLSDMFRVLKKDGMLVVLEFSKPAKFPIKQIYTFYFNMVLPVIGKVFSDDNSAYTYLPESVEAFPDGDDFLELMMEQGFVETTCRPLLFGIASIYTGKK
ncbi:MAG: bifunctional demethylmenaquinone methyltransferase/2-methoxy-6-polyprenyl-1,4-benzoquinol methylase UbiE [Flavobacteriales bacterium]|nr:bifunctional demethylmenaquinone methyltransferase/2-methoxy-6-polyprenyl-1,4-benzoquinol methylase UbiE [Flavobacteriales bacterium]